METQRGGRRESLQIGQNLPDDQREAALTSKTERQVRVRQEGEAERSLGDQLRDSQPPAAPPSSRALMALPQSQLCLGCGEMLPGAQGPHTRRSLHGSVLATEPL